MRTITSKFDSKCRKCGKNLPKGSTVVWEKGKGVFCTECEKPASRPAPFRSARRSYARRNDRWEPCRCNAGRRLVGSREGGRDTLIKTYQCSACGRQWDEWIE
jgi:hypothetical protein